MPQKYKTNPTLGRWVNWQRKQFKSNSLAKDCIAELNRIEFVWDKRKRPSNKKSTSASSPPKKRAKRTSKKNDGNSSIYKETDCDELNDSEPDENFGPTVVQEKEVLQFELNVADPEQTEELDSELSGSVETVEVGNGPPGAEAPVDYTKAEMRELLLSATLD